jgi:cysteinyl-tRNA synthetase
MSKSLGNYFTIQEILKAHDAVALRRLFLGSHYRSPMNFSAEALQEAARASDRVYETIERARGATGAIAAGAVRVDPALLNDFRQEMDDDFNTPRALALIFEEVRSVNRLLDQKKTAEVALRVEALKAMCEVLGLLQDSLETFFDRKKERWLRQQNLTCEWIEKWIEERNRARAEKNWGEADRLRQELLEKGIVIEDTPRGTLWKVR